jgi:hypothetical protein
MRLNNNPGPPRVDIVTRAIEHYHWGILLLLANVDSVLRVDSHSSYHAKGPTLGQRTPLVYHFIFELTGTYFNH